ncbi:helix-turn-helix transcriptional regulator [Stappia sp. BW2]|uniref:helix-turn-helix domain-containing protein n=1 Tax=Stappia sp. BW2 TaxID=2592622 RepID=UPI0011DE64CE|nr:helix-turn-helix transcriptional regulator [Stappia sp. BW2]TYC70151.1 helix-turn-helix transcriptional regulator [Stappia sp. BW2]
MRGDTFKILQGVLKARGMTYADLARRMDISEPTVKRIFAGHDCKLSRLLEICDILEVPLSDVLHRAARNSEEASVLPIATEARLAADPSLFYLFILLREPIPQGEIQRRFDLSGEDMFRMGRSLEALGLVEVHPGNHIKVLHKEPLRFRPDGPLIPLLKEINTRFLGQVIANPSGNQSLFFTLSRRMLPDTGAFILREIETLKETIAELARQDQLVSREEDLTTFKLTGAFAPVSFPDILTIEPAG